MKFKLITALAFVFCALASITNAVSAVPLGDEKRGHVIIEGTGTTGPNMKIVRIQEQPLSGMITFSVTVTGFGGPGAFHLTSTADIIGDSRSKMRILIQSPEGNTGACFYQFVTPTVTTTTLTGINIEPGAVPHQFDDLAFTSTILFMVETGGDTCECTLWFNRQDDSGD